MSNVDTLYLVHHSHTDIGYTHDQPIVWDLHERFIEAAIDLAESYADSDGDHAFRWTVETTGVLQRWLRHAAPAHIDRFIALERAGRIEVTGMPANITPLFDTDQLAESLQPLHTLRRDYGFTIRHAMNCDVNGHNWPLVDVLLDAGIESFSMAINTHFGGFPFTRPYPFWWQGPGGRKILALNGFHYMAGWHFGIGRDADLLEQQWWPRIAQHLDAIGYPLSALLIQTTDPFGDNGSAWAGYASFIEAWNAQGRQPRLRMATPSMWGDAVRPEAARLPAHAGDWTDYWNFGCASSARELRVNRASRVRLRTADALAAVLSADAGEDVARRFARYREPAWHSLNFWDEHTWGADVSVSAPESDDTASQWAHKARYAYRARSLSLMLQRDALAGLARQVRHSAPTDVLIFNALPWPRRIAGAVSPFVTSPRGLPEDATSARHFQDHGLGIEPLSGERDPTKLSPTHALPPTDVPGFGYVVVPQAGLIDLREATRVSRAAVVENYRHRLTFDRERGGVVSWYDKQLDHEWVDAQAGYAFNGFVHEQVADAGHASPRQLMFSADWRLETVAMELVPGWHPDWPALRRPSAGVVHHQVCETPLGHTVIQHVRAWGCEGLLRQSVFLPAHAGYVECEASWEMGTTTHPEATYLLYPFNLPGATARFDVGGQAVEAGRDQLPGVCRDYFTVQQWVDFSNGGLGMTVATPDNPMVQLGDFHFGRHQETFVLERPMLLGWVTNNYWETNFRAHQPGRVRARYRLLPYRGGFDEARAHRFGLEAAHAGPLVQQGGEPSGPRPPAPEAGALLRLPGHDGTDTPVLTLHIKPATRTPGMVLRLFNASDVPRTAAIGSGLIEITSAHRCTLFEEPEQALAVQAGTVQVPLPPRQITVVHLDVIPIS